MLYNTHTHNGILVEGRDNIKVGTKCDLESDTQESKVTLSADISDNFNMTISGQKYTGDPIKVDKSKIWIKLEYKYNEPVPNGQEIKINADDPSGNLKLEIRG